MYGCQALVRDFSHTPRQKYYGSYNTATPITHWTLVMNSKWTFDGLVRYTPFGC